MFSNIGVAKSIHLCMGSEMMAEFGIATKHLDCGMDMQEDDNSSNSNQSIDSNDCCQNKFELVHNDKDQNVKVLKIDAAQVIFIAAFTQTFIFGIAPTIITEQPIPHNTPPSIEKDFSILFQSFLI
jgi:hypothetical protein